MRLASYDQWLRSLKVAECQTDLPQELILLNVTSCTGGTNEPDTDEEAQKNKRNILFYYTIAAQPALMFYTCQIRLTGGPVGHRTYGFVRLLPGVSGSLRTATNQSLRSPRQGSSGWSGDYFWASWWTPVLSDASPPPPAAQGEGMMGRLVKGEMKEHLKLDTADEGMEWLMTEQAGEGSWLQDSEMVTEHSLPLRWMSDLIKVNRLR